jgi:hypothetical protein
MRYSVMFHYMYTMYNDQIWLVSIYIILNIYHLFVMRFKVLPSSHFGMCIIGKYSLLTMQ